MSAEAGLELRKKLAQATHKRRVSGGKQGALPFYGFCYFEGKIVRDPREFPTLQMVRQHWKGGRTVHQIVRVLNRVRIRSRKGRDWSWAAVSNIVARPRPEIYA